MPILNTLLNGFRSAAGVGGRRAGSSFAPRRRPPVPEISSGEAGENRRTVDALLRSDADGLVPDIYAEEITARGPAGHAYFRDFERELRRRDPARADGIRTKVLGLLDPADRDVMTMEFRDADGDGRDDRFREPERRPGGRRPHIRPVPAAARPGAGLIGPGGEGTAEETPTRSSSPLQSPHPEAPPEEIPDATKPWPIHHPDRIDKETAVAAFERVRAGEGTFGKPRPIHPSLVPENWPKRWVPEEVVDVGGALLSPETAQLLEEVLQVEDNDAARQALWEKINESDVQHYSKQRLGALMWPKYRTSRIDADEPARRREAILDSLRVLDLRSALGRWKVTFGR